MDSPIPPVINEPDFFPFPDYKVFRLSNGIPVHIIPFNNLEFTNVLVSVKAGSQCQDKLLQASLTGRMLREGCKGYSSEKLAEELDFYGTTFRTSVSTLCSESLMSSVSRHLPKMLPLLQSIIFEPSFSQKEFDIANSVSKQNLVHSLQEVSFLANRQFKRMVFGDDHVYARTAQPDDFDKVSVDDLQRYHSKFYLPNNLELFAAGRLTDVELGLLDKSFGQLPFSSLPSNVVEEPVATPCAEVRRVFDKEGCQSAVSMGYVTIAQQHPDWLKLKLLVAILGGYFGSRLMSNIREDKGYTYGIYAQLVAYSNMSTILISSQTAIEHTNALIDEVYKEIDRLVSEPVPADELLMVKRYFIGLYLQQASKGLDLLSDYRIKVLNGLDPQSYYKEWWNVLHTTTADDLLQIAKKYLKPELIKVSIAGKC